MKKIILIIVSSFVLLNAQNEFVVNTHLDTVQRYPAAVKFSTGGYAVVWQSLNQVSGNSDYDIYMQIFDDNDQKVGSEILVNQITQGIQERPAAAVNADGIIAVVWSSFSGGESAFDIKARLFNNSTPVSDEFIVNTYTPGSQSNPSADVNENGVVFTWDSWNQDGGDRGVYLKMFDLAGTALSAESPVNQTTAYSQAKPRIKFFADGKFAVVWESFKQDGSGYGVYGRVFNSSGTAAGSEFQINTYTADYQWYPDLETFSDNSFVVTWCSWEQDGYDGGIYFQRLDQQGIKTGEEIRVNKSVSYYQWLPRVKKIDGTRFAVIWSSWKQDGSREGVYTAYVNEVDEVYTFETQLNQYEESFQWEPDLIVLNSSQILGVWSSWNQSGNDYDIVARRIIPPIPQGVIRSSSVQHTSGRTSGRVFAHVVDSTLLNGHTYQVSFDTTSSNEMLFATVTDITASQVKINSFPVNRGKGIVYNTAAFDGLIVEISPEYKLEINSDDSYFINHSNSNLIFSYGVPTAGQRLIAPIDIALVWGSTDTLPGGAYASPFDTAISTTGQPVIMVPFKARNINGNTKVKMLVKEITGKMNNRWDPGETVVFLTPPPYNVNNFNTHAQISTALPGGSFIMPDEGDTNIVLTRRPVTPEDKFTFIANKNLIVSDSKSADSFPGSFELMQNYPNPFNPSTTIRFSLASEADVELKIYDILGREVSTLVKGLFKPGTYSFEWNGKNSYGADAASGVYIYRIGAGNLTRTKKMMLIR